ncbi:hypothetical protein GNI_118590, partial [Gregarina niphandrodes]
RATRGVEELPEVVEELPEVIEELPEVVEELPEVVEELPEVIEELPEAVEELPEVVEELPDVIEGLPEMVEELPEVIEELPEMVEELPEVIEAMPEVVEEMAEEVVEEVPEFVSAESLQEEARLITEEERASDEYVSLEPTLESLPSGEFADELVSEAEYVSSEGEYVSSPEFVSDEDEEYASEEYASEESEEYASEEDEEYASEEDEEYASEEDREYASEEGVEDLVTSMEAPEAVAAPEVVEKVVAPNVLVPGAVVDPTSAVSASAMQEQDLPRLVWGDVPPVTPPTPPVAAKEPVIFLDGFGRPVVPEITPWDELNLPHIEFLEDPELGLIRLDAKLDEFGRPLAPDMAPPEEGAMAVKPVVKPAIKAAVEQAVERAVPAAAPPLPTAPGMDLVEAGRGAERPEDRARIDLTAPDLATQYDRVTLSKAPGVQTGLGDVSGLDVIDMVVGPDFDLSTLDIEEGRRRPSAVVAPELETVAGGERGRAKEGGLDGLESAAGVQVGRKGGDAAFRLKGPGELDLEVDGLRRFGKATPFKPLEAPKGREVPTLKEREEEAAKKPETEEARRTKWKESLPKQKVEAEPEAEAARRRVPGGIRPKLERKETGDIVPGRKIVVRGPPVYQGQHRFGYRPDAAETVPSLRPGLRPEATEETPEQRDLEHTRVVEREAPGGAAVITRKPISIPDAFKYKPGGFGWEAKLSKAAKPETTGPKRFGFGFGPRGPVTELPQRKKEEAEVESRGRRISVQHGALPDAAGPQRVDLRPSGRVRPGAAGPRPDVAVQRPDFEKALFQKRPAKAPPGPGFRPVTPAEELSPEEDLSSEMLSSRRAASPRAASPRAPSERSPSEEEEPSSPSEETVSEEVISEEIDEDGNVQTRTYKTHVRRKKPPRPRRRRPPRTTAEEEEVEMVSTEESYESEDAETGKKVRKKRRVHRPIKKVIQDLYGDWERMAGQFGRGKDRQRRRRHGEREAQEDADWGDYLGDQGTAGTAGRRRPGRPGARGEGAEGEEGGGDFWKGFGFGGPERPGDRRRRRPGAPAEEEEEEESLGSEVGSEVASDEVVVAPDGTRRRRRPRRRRADAGPGGPGGGDWEAMYGAGGGGGGKAGEFGWGRMRKVKGADLNLQKQLGRYLPTTSAFSKWSQWRRGKEEDKRKKKKKEPKRDSTELIPIIKLPENPRPAPPKSPPDIASLRLEGDVAKRRRKQAAKKAGVEAGAMDFWSSQYGAEAAPAVTSELAKVRLKRRKHPEERHRRHAGAAEAAAGAAQPDWLAFLKVPEPAV